MPDSNKSALIKKLLLKRAFKVGLVTNVNDFSDDVIEKLLEKEVPSCEPSDEECLNYYEENKDKYTTKDLYEVSHILFSEASLAEDVLKTIKTNPNSFEVLVKEYSSCASAGSGGYLGEITKDHLIFESSPEILEGAEEGVLAKVIESPVGFHIIKVHSVIKSENISFDAMKDWIYKNIKDLNWKKSVNKYIENLISQAED